MLIQHCLNILIVSNYCYNIFLFRQFNSTKWNSINSIKRKVIFLCLGWMNGMEWNCVIASSIKKSKLFFNYGMIGYMFCLHSHSNSILHLIQPFNFLYYLQTLQFSYCLNILSSLLLFNCCGLGPASNWRKEEERGRPTPHEWRRCCAHNQ